MLLCCTATEPSFIPSAPPAPGREIGREMSHLQSSHAMPRAPTPAPSAQQCSYLLLRPGSFMVNRTHRRNPPEICMATSAHGWPPSGPALQKRGSVRARAICGCSGACRHAQMEKAMHRRCFRRCNPQGSRIVCQHDLLFGETGDDTWQNPL